ncbi:hypothetical protein SAMN06297387_1266 [Streptomyces zhaozhouensis]|uniref:DUF5667 domain-containing protein n=1 Tax=Streptomyces zhaozhouensis TaxID=1300267 RepID=A0A286E6G4_9ACTN|nr:DUF5667 domain-containing protein [Streptomyces zhaozhouensis]SOD66461.1 hypothetical protein SAMN06297387_1266 [Streptomyces zhaozhouensis]
MIGSVSANRRAQAFAQLLDEARPPGDAQAPEAPHRGEGATTAERGTTAAQADQSALLSVVERLAALPKPELSADARAAQRAALLAAMDEAGSTAAEPPRVPAQTRRADEPRPSASPLSRLRPRSRLSKGLAAGGLTFGVAAGAFGGVAAASNDALPGDTLYGLKRGMEDLRLDFASGDADRGQLYLDQATTRLHEARDLLARQTSAALDHERLGDIRRALSNMRDDASEGHRLLTRAYENQGSIGSIQSLSSFFEGQNTTWEEVRRSLPPQLGDVRQEVTDVLDAMREDIAPLRSLLPPEPADEESDEESDERHNASLRPPTAATTDEESGERPEETTSEPLRTRSEPSTTGPEPSEESEGLLEGTGGLLDGVTPETEDPTEGPDASPESPKGETDITIPPLLEDLLPRLDLDVSSTEEGR